MHKAFIMVLILLGASFFVIPTQAASGLEVKGTSPQFVSPSTSISLTVSVLIGSSGLPPPAAQTTVTCTVYSPSGSLYTTYTLSYLQNGIWFKQVTSPPIEGIYTLLYEASRAATGGRDIQSMKVTNLENSVSQIITDLSTMESDILAAISQLRQETTLNFNDIRSRIDASKTEILTAIANLEQETNTNFDNVQTRINTLEITLTTELNQINDLIVQSTSTIEQKIDNLQVAIGDVYNIVDDRTTFILNDLTTIKQKIDALQTEVDTLEQKIDQLSADEQAHYQALVIQLSSMQILYGKEYNLSYQIRAEMISMFHHIDTDLGQLNNINLVTLPPLEIGKGEHFKLQAYLRRASGEIITAGTVTATLKQGSKVLYQDVKLKFQNGIFVSDELVAPSEAGVVLVDYTVQCSPTSHSYEILTIESTDAAPATGSFFEQPHIQAAFLILALIISFLLVSISLGYFGKSKI